MIRLPADIHKKVAGVDGGDVAGGGVIVVALLPRAQQQREGYAVHPCRQLPQKVILREHRAHDAQPRVVGGRGGTAGKGQKKKQRRKKGGKKFFQVGLPPFATRGTFAEKHRLPFVDGKGAALQHAVQHRIGRTLVEVDELAADGAFQVQVRVTVRAADRLIQSAPLSAAGKALDLPFRHKLRQQAVDGAFADGARARESGAKLLGSERRVGVLL